MHALKCSKFALDCLETFVGSFRCVKCIRSYCLYTKRTEMTWIRGWSLESSEMVLYLFLGARRCLCPIMIAIAPWPVIQIIELLWETFKSNGQLQTSFACRMLWLNFFSRLGSRPHFQWSNSFHHGIFWFKSLMWTFSNWICWNCCIESVVLHLETSKTRF